MNVSRLRVLPLAFSFLAAMGASGCIITTTDDGDDDGMAGDDGSGGAGDDSGGAGEDGMADDGSGGADGGPSGNADAPGEGTWLYTETGNTTNDCNFFDATNGWGTYEVVGTEGGFQVIPGDDTEPFDCTSSGGSFDCPERLVDQSMEGDATLDVLVSITGTLPSEDEMAGTQDGIIECSGADCGLAEQLLMTTFPCSFSIEFTGMRQ